MPEVKLRIHTAMTSFRSLPTYAVKSCLKDVAKQGARLPGAIEAFWLIYRLLRRLPFYDSCWRYAPQWFAELWERQDVLTHDPQCRVLFFSSVVPWINYSLALSTVLAGRGVDVDFGWLLHPNVVDENPTFGYTHWRRAARSVKGRLHHPRLRLHDLEGVEPVRVNTDMGEIAHEQALIDVSYLLRTERLHIDTDPLHRRTYELRREYNLDAISRVARMINQSHYDRLIVPNGVVLGWGAVKRYASGLGLPTSSIEMWDIAGKVVVSKVASAVKIDTSALWAADEPHELTESRRQRVMAFFQARQKASNPVLRIKYQRTNVQSPDVTRREIGCHSGKPVVLICPNVPFDSIFYVERRKNFSAMWEWLVRTVEHLSGRTDCTVIIRSHPGEGRFKTSETSEAIIREHFSKLPAHISFVPSRAPINTYSLMQIADIGLVYASTTALEMAMLGIPVVCGISNQHYNQKGFTHDPVSVHEYFAKIDMIVRDPAEYRLSPRQIELATCYADIYFNQWCRAFPWHVRTLHRDMKAWPIRRMLSEEGQREYGGVLDELSGQ